MRAAVTITVDLVPRPIAPAMARVIVLRAHHKAHHLVHPLRTEQHRVRRLRTLLQAVVAGDTRVAANLMVAVVEDTTVAGGTNPQAAC
jgi:hypothetical protein